ncbi:hypothetical protein EDD18DRAFT_1188276 [Armillaria luteobubalina]|uniref:Uncharacterized protein n=1 Tax=Armillaria luteobubalina TaxID=153913 RepID=A0AA39PTH2_9AGAR|nr:hypothetical protein EDD18DRAFT_1188276 [Armillaria luteobubalina]
MFFYASILFITLANILLPMWVPGIALFLGAFQSIIHSILSNRILLLILTQRWIHRHNRTEELYSSVLELSDVTSGGPGSENEAKNIPRIRS